MFEMIIRRQSIEEWASEADVVVVGCGMAGICAAIEAREAGAAVVVLDRAGACVGSTAVAAGHFYLGGGTAVQAACGFEDSAAALAAYLTAVTEEPDHAKIGAFATGSAAHFDWLEAHGVPFDRSYFSQKAVIQPGRECLIWTGNERVWPFREQANPAPRGHKVACEGMEGGGKLALSKLVQHALGIGVRILFDNKVDAIILDGNRIVGVQSRTAQQVQHHYARSGVILAAGGFSQNKGMMLRYLSRFAAINIMAGAYDDGLAIELGVAAGGAVEHMDGCLVTSPIYPPEQLVRGILVNRDGKRFVAEDSYHTRASIAIADQPAGIAYLIVDADTFAYPEWSRHANQRLVDGFATVAEMQIGLELPETSLQRTLDAYNQHAAQGLDPDFGKHPDWLVPLTQGPWAAFDFSFGRAVYNGFTLGGLKISMHGEVINSSGTPIPGLYAAGACSSMLAHDARDYASGISLSGASFFGRAAGRHAAAI